MAWTLEPNCNINVYTGQGFESLPVGAPVYSDVAQQLRPNQMPVIPPGTNAPPDWSHRFVVPGGAGAFLLNIIPDDPGTGNICILELVIKIGILYLSQYFQITDMSFSCIGPDGLGTDVDACFLYCLLMPCH